MADGMLVPPVRITSGEKKREAQPRGWHAWLVVKEEHCVRKVWDFFVAWLLLYTATIFPYRLVFIDFRLPRSRRPDEKLESYDFWFYLEYVVTILFGIDLVVNFFFTYRDNEGREVKDLRRIAIKYLMSYFIINLVACIPEDTISWCVNIAFGHSKGAGDSHEALRLVRLPRVTRLLRLVRLTRLAKVKAFMERNSMWKWLQESMPASRLINFVFFLGVITHLLSCGWYLVAVLEPNVDECWLARRVLGVDETPLLDLSALTHWIHAMYFVFTVFTTVGFGDISAFTTSEIFYVTFTMMVGTVVNSIVVGEVIAVVTRVDERQRHIDRRIDIFRGFVKHTDVTSQLPSVVDAFADWIVSSSCRSEVEFDREGMIELLDGGKVPRELIGELPGRVYNGCLVKNKMLVSCQEKSYSVELPPRFVVLVSLLLHRQYYHNGEAIYHAHDHPFSAFLVQSGTFAYFAVPSEMGGRDEAPYCFIKKSEPVKSINVALTVPNALRRLRASRTDSSSLLESRQSHFPYALFSHGTYFGDYEVVGKAADGIVRKTSARCCRHGALLLLLKKDLQVLRDQFPQYCAMWRVSAKRRESQRLSFLSRHKHRYEFEELAARTIQAAVRTRISLKGPLSIISQTSMMSMPRSDNEQRWRDQADKPYKDQSVDAGSPIRSYNSSRTAVRNNCHENNTAVRSGSSNEWRSEVAELRAEMRIMRNDVRQCLQALQAKPKSPIQL